MTPLNVVEGGSLGLFAREPSCLHPCAGLSCKVRSFKLLTCFNEWHNDKDVVVYAAPLVPADYECRPIFFFLMVMVGVELILKIYSGCALVAAIKVQMPG